MAEKLADSLLQDFMGKFYGYGDYYAKYWFIGMEEGGGTNFDEINNRVNVWKSRGSRELEDVAQYHDAIAAPKNYFGDNPVLQSTWRRLILVYLGLTNSEVDDKQVREYQGKNWGRWDSKTCLLELLPLPSRSTRKSDWLYAQYSDLPCLISRQKYKDCYIEDRKKHLKRKVHENIGKVKSIIFYSFSYLKYWQEIAGITFDKCETPMYVGKREGTVFAAILHPNYWRTTDEYFKHIARLLRDKIDNC